MKHRPSLHECGHILWTTGIFEESVGGEDDGDEEMDTVDNGKQSGDDCEVGSCDEDWKTMVGGRGEGEE